MDYERVLNALVRRINRLVRVSVSPQTTEEKRLLCCAEIQFLTDIGLKFIDDNTKGLTYALDKQQIKIHKTQSAPLLRGKKSQQRDENWDDGSKKKVRFSRVLTVRSD